MSSSPVPASTAAFPSSPTISPVPTVPDLPRLSLRVVVDPIPVGAASAGGLFYISVDPEDDVSGIRRAISEKLGDMAMSIFKVCPCDRVTEGELTFLRSLSLGRPSNKLEPIPSDMKCRLTLSQPSSPGTLITRETSLSASVPQGGQPLLGAAMPHRKSRTGTLFPSPVKMI